MFSCQFNGCLANYFDSYTLVGTMFEVVVAYCLAQMAIRQWQNAVSVSLFAFVSIPFQSLVDNMAFIAAGIHIHLQVALEVTLSLVKPCYMSPKSVGVGVTSGRAANLLDYLGALVFRFAECDDRCWHRQAAAILQALFEMEGRLFKGPFKRNEWQTAATPCRATEARAVQSCVISSFRVA